LGHRARPKELKSADDPVKVLPAYLDDNNDVIDSSALDALCESGGAPEAYAEYRVDDATIEGSHCIATITAFFSEIVYASGCSNMPTHKERGGQIEMNIDLDTGDYEL
jgi:hypothetical protein